MLVFALVAIFAPLIAPHDPNETDLFRRLQPPAWMEGGELAHLLDNLRERGAGHAFRG